MIVKQTMAAVMAAGLLASCTLTGNAAANAEKVYNQICSAEPPIYASVKLASVANNWSPAKVRKLETAHTSVMRFCNDRPTDLISALTTLSAAYAEVLALKAQTE